MNIKLLTFTSLLTLIVNVQAQQPCQMGGCNAIDSQKIVTEKMIKHRTDISEAINSTGPTNPNPSLKSHNWSTSKKDKKVNRNGIKRVKAHEGVVSEFNNHDTVDSKENPYTAKERRKAKKIMLIPSKK